MNKGSAEEEKEEGDQEEEERTKRRLNGGERSGGKKTGGQFSVKLRVVVYCAAQVTAAAGTLSRHQWWRR